MKGRVSRERRGATQRSSTDSLYTWPLRLELSQVKVRGPKFPPGLSWMAGAQTFGPFPRA